MKKTIRDFFNGLAFGITETVPGVSGGTIALILGFYFELIETINHFSENIKKRLKFLIPLVLGIAVGILLFSSLINFLLANYSFPTMLFFIGLIAGIIPHIYAKVKEQGRRLQFRDILLIVIPFVFLLALSFLRTGDSATSPEEMIHTIGFPYMIFILVAGIVAAAALVIPGISGSFVLLLLGVYPLAIYAVSLIRTLLTDITNIDLMLSICKVLIPLAIGIIIGGLSMARLIGKLLKNHSRTTYSIILGIMLGSLCVLFKNPIVYASGVSAWIIVAGVITFCLGCVLSFNIGKKRL
ncbi:MAG: DUF368 domain-containing protein [Dehalococcoidia bacterium]|nr:DUF368 domain-containing protein [Dehalococcoidia bacterium]